MDVLKVSSGSATPLGPSSTSSGVNFALFAPHAEEITLILFHEKGQPLQEFHLSSKRNRTGAVWHIHLENPPPKIIYAYRLGDSSCEYVLDPYSPEIYSSYSWMDPSPYRPLSAFDRDYFFDWEGVSAPKIASKDLVMYEAHLRGFTQHSSSDVSHPGTYLGFIEKIPHLKKLGINAVKLLPVFEFNEKEYTKISPVTEKQLCNYWGYSTVHFKSPNNRYANTSSLNEFKTLVKSLHQADLLVILDVVFNHTAEGGSTGPTYSFKALDATTYYIHDKSHPFLDFSGCGNSVSCNNPIVLEWMIHCLRYWVEEMHVDGFRFDLAAEMYRSSHGEILPNPPILEAISKDPILRNTWLIAEPWDATGCYLVGGFYLQSTRWMEWNGKYRDTVRRYIKGTKGEKGRFATCLSGSQDLYGTRSPQNSINFITCHDGFSLRDLVSYNNKHNLANAENNRDGSSYNDSWNCGVEGATSLAPIEALRVRQMKNFQFALMISQGIPLFTMGDEYGHTKQGNNNTWCQDNELNWFLWDQLEGNPFFLFCQKLLILRKTLPHFRKEKFLTVNDVEWHGREPQKPLWDHTDPVLSFTLKDENDPRWVYIAFNPQENPATLTLPKLPEEGSWGKVIDTFEPFPVDFRDLNNPLKVEGPSFRMAPFSAILLTS